MLVDKTLRWCFKSCLRAHAQLPTMFKPPQARVNPCCCRHHSSLVEQSICRLTGRSSSPVMEGRPFWALLASVSGPSHC
jgi:hypothetical protein